MAYNHPSQEIAQYLLNEGLVNAGEIFVDHHPDINSINAPFITTVKMVGGVPNPLWLHDEITISINVLGTSKDVLVAARDQLWSVYNKLLGIDNITLNGYVYLRFISQEMPNLAGYLDNSKPIYTSSFSFVREAQTVEGNRKLIS